MSNNSFGLAIFIISTTTITYILFNKNKYLEKRRKNSNILENYDNNSIFIPITKNKIIKKQEEIIEKKIDTEDGYISDDENEDDPDGFDTINHKDIPKNYCIKNTKSESCTYKKIKNIFKKITYSL